ncbi:hypothetical protein N2600_25515 (plasmid) [Rhizobium sp. WSM1274]|uniref:hypothetical protein n=1 Tax=Rhizobium sp. TaxID=391 RepID=UPI0021A2B344|nr:hypothetical protein [Rhizobium leguminosarum]UWU31861.1 hypothetical protein N2600_25515 [Rhizobium leguminosarum bv. viciae]
MTGKSISTTPADGVIEAISASHILHPHRHVHFTSPNEILAADISVQDNRAILASWASDLFAVESVLELRQPPRVPPPVRYAEIITALKAPDSGGGTAGRVVKELGSARPWMTSHIRGP